MWLQPGTSLGAATHAPAIAQHEIVKGQVVHLLRVAAEESVDAAIRFDADYARNSQEQLLIHPPAGRWLPSPSKTW